MSFGLAGSAEYDNNVYRTNAAKKDDFVFRITPKVQFLEDEGKLRWNLGYQLPWENAIETDKVGGFYHVLNAKASYQVNGRTQVFFSDAFTRSDEVGRFYSIEEAGVTPTLSTYREPVDRNSATFGAQRSFTPRWMGNLAFSHRLFASDIPRRSDAMVYGANTNLVYILSSRHRLGGGAAATYQDFEASDDGAIAPSQTFFLNLYATWTWTLNETTKFELTGGPTFVDNNQDAPVPVVQRQVIPYFERGGDLFAYTLADCGQVNGHRVLDLCRTVTLVNDPTQAGTIRTAGTQAVTFQAGERPSSRSDSSLTFFGVAAFTKRWSRRLHSTLTYQRTESTASGTGSSTLDLMSLFTGWRISELWDLGLRADYTKRRSTGPITETYTVVRASAVNGALAETIPASDLSQTGLTSRVVKRSLDTDRWGVSARMSRRLTKHVYASLRYSYNEQASKADTAGSSSDFSNHLVTLGVQYDFDRWHLW